jgi:hypothetical protein
LFILQLDDLKLPEEHPRRARWQASKFGTFLFSFYVIRKYESLGNDFRFGEALGP